MTDYLQHMGVERGLAANTLSAYRRDLARYARYLAHAGRQRPAEITRHDVTGFVQALSDGSDGGSALGVRSAARTVVAVRGLHKFWALEGVTPTDPASDVHPPMPGKRLPKAISVDEVTRILEAAGTDTATGLRDRALLEFLYSTGARISEAVGLDVDDISLHAPGEETNPVRPLSGSSARGPRNGWSRSVRSGPAPWTPTWSAAGRCWPPRAKVRPPCF